ncbi:MAG: hypothetical protein KZQ93_06205 [Candidatus Thiodiazotropha sp. (ex Monitilora ramsayi)]|nr:hypothetical protein [Candidatus Thiodiazotropha sp. (ex Monitilora ramsayi)]
MGFIKTSTIVTGLAASILLAASMGKVILFMLSRKFSYEPSGFHLFIVTFIAAYAIWRAVKYKWKFNLKISTKLGITLLYVLLVTITLNYMFSLLNGTEQAVIGILNPNGAVMLFGEGVCVWAGLSLDDDQKKKTGNV